MAEKAEGFRVIELGTLPDGARQIGLTGEITLLYHNDDFALRVGNKIGTDGINKR
jgi:hypothetical protein